MEYLLGQSSKLSVEPRRIIQFRLKPALYFLKPGETCSLSSSKHPKMQQREIRAVAQLETRLLIVPNEYLDKWICEYPSWQNFVFQTYLKPIYTLLGALDSYVFFKEEDQVYRYLQSMQIY